MDMIKSNSIHQAAIELFPRPLLFTGTIADNISQTNPDASSEEIVQAAKLACAHDFIMDLPNGYSTPAGKE